MQISASRNACPTGIVTPSRRRAGRNSKHVIFQRVRFAILSGSCKRRPLLSQLRLACPIETLPGAISLFCFSPSLSARSGLFVAVISAKNGALTNNTATAGSFHFSLPIFFGCAGRTGHHRKFEVRSWKFEVGSQF